MKICSKCKIEKDECEFFFKNKNKNILHSYCKKCKREIDKNTYKNNTNGRKEKVRNRTNQSKIELREFYQEYKKSKCCEMCGEKRWYVLDFHHIRDKKYEISQLIKKGSLKLLLNELDKCIPVCANCHREIHHKEGYFSSSGRAPA